MTLLTNQVTVEVAAMRALKAFLQAQFNADAFWTSKPVEVNDSWPMLEQDLPPRAVSIIKAGARQDERHFPMIDGSVVVDANTKDWIWNVAACDQPIQIDIWATSEVDRNSLERSLDEYLHRGPKYSLGIPNGDPIRDGVLVALGDGFTGTADCQFDGIAAVPTPEQIRRTEWRSMTRGMISVQLTVKSRDKRLLRSLLRMKLGEATPGPSANFDYDANGIKKGTAQI